MEKIKRASELIGKGVKINDIEVNEETVLVYYNDSGEDFSSMLEFDKDYFFNDENINKDIFALSEIIEHKNGLKETNILMVSEDLYKLRERMENELKKDSYGFIKKNGIETYEEDYLETNYKQGSFILTINNYLV